MELHMKTKGGSVGSMRRWALRAMGVWAMMLVMTHVALGQVHTVTVVCDSVPNLTRRDGALFVRGAFNQWACNDSSAMLRRNAQGQYVGQVRWAGDSISYTVCTGLPAPCAGNKKGVRLPLFRWTRSMGNEAHVSIGTWIVAKDHRNTTAKPHVRHIPTTMPVKGLGVRVSCHVYVPPSHRGGAKYPVIYVLNGDEAFDACSGGGVEWGLDETLDSLNVRRSLGAIVVSVNLPAAVTRNFYAVADQQGRANKHIKALTDFVLGDLHSFVKGLYPVCDGRESLFVMGAGNKAELAMAMILDRPAEVGGGVVVLPGNAATWMADEARAVKSKRPAQRIAVSLPDGNDRSGLQGLARAGGYATNELRLFPLGRAVGCGDPSQWGRTAGRSLLWLLGQEGGDEGETIQ